MGRACSYIWERSAFKAMWENLKARNHYEVLDVDGRIILKLFLKKLDEYVLDSCGAGK
jgi:hypothetical protein